MALHFGKGSALACIIPALLLSCAGLFQHAGWGMMFAIAILSVVAAMSLAGAVSFYLTLAIRLALGRDRVRHLLIARSLLTWSGVASPLVVFASIAMGGRLRGGEPDWRIVIPAMCAPGVVIAAFVPRPLCRR